MRLALIGLGKMGANMARRLLQAKIEVVGFNRSPGIVKELSGEGLIPADTILHAVQQLQSPRIIWLMIPSGSPTDHAIQDLIPMLEGGDIIIDGGNSNYHDSQRHGALLAKHGIGFVDAGTSGGIWGLKNGYCLMVGGEKQVVAQIEPVLKALAPAQDRGWAHVGPIGAGHFTKMIHNGIEYGMMQAFSEGFSLMKGKEEFNLDMAQISELWRHSSVVRSWLLDLMADFLVQDQELKEIEPFVADSGEGRWTVVEAVDQGIAAPVLSLALQMRFSSQDSEGYGNRLLSMMRNAFGGHFVQGKE